MSEEKTKHSRREILKKSTYVVPAVLTMAIAPSLTTSVSAQTNKGKSKGKGKGDPAPVPEPGTIGMLGLGLATLAGAKAFKDKQNDKED